MNAFELGVVDGMEKEAFVRAGLAAAGRGVARAGSALSSKSTGAVGNLGARLAEKGKAVASRQSGIIAAKQRIKDTKAMVQRSLPDMTTAQQQAARKNLADTSRATMSRAKGSAPKPVDLPPAPKPGATPAVKPTLAQRLKRPAAYLGAGAAIGAGGTALASSGQQA